MLLCDRQELFLPGSLLGRALLAGMLLRTLFGWYFGAFLPGLGKSDRYRLFLARYFLARAAAFQRTVFPLVHGFLDLFSSLLAVSCHFRYHLLESLHHSFNAGPSFSPAKTDKFVWQKHEPQFWVSVCNLCVLCVSVVENFRAKTHHRDTENTEVAQRRALIAIFVQRRPV